jgi:hypothetical protein
MSRARRSTSTPSGASKAWSILGEFFTRTDDLQNATTTTEQIRPAGRPAAPTCCRRAATRARSSGAVGRARQPWSAPTTATTAAVNYLTGLQGLGGADGDSTEITVVVDAFYHGHMAKSQIEYTFQDVDFTAGTDPTNHILRVGFQLLF